jgi:hypothetical protein
MDPARLQLLEEALDALLKVLGMNSANQLGKHNQYFDVQPAALSWHHPD